MTVPPPSGQWGPYVQPPSPPLQPTTPGYHSPQGPWGAPQPPRKQNNTIKWMLSGVGLLLVIATTVGVTILVTREETAGDGPAPTSTIEPVDSADDDGPVEIVTLEPTCNDWRNLQRSLATTQSNGWGQRDSTVPASEWTPAQRDQFAAVAESMRANADLAVELSKQTPHRVMRELYMQFVAYGRAYADAVDTYVPADDYLARANVGFSKTISGICDAIEFGDVISRASQLPLAEAPINQGGTVSIDNPARFLSGSPEACVDWVQANTQFESRLQDWTRLDPEISAPQWTPEQRSVQEAAARTFDEYGAEIVSIGQGSGNATLEDFSNLMSLYMGAYAVATPTYSPNDNYLISSALRLNNAITAACQSSTS